MDDNMKYMMSLRRQIIGLLTGVNVIIDGAVWNGAVDTEGAAVEVHDKMQSFAKNEEAGYERLQQGD